MYYPYNMFVVSHRMLDPLSIHLGDPLSIQFDMFGQVLITSRRGMLRAIQDALSGRATSVRAHNCFTITPVTLFIASFIHRDLCVCYPLYFFVFGALSGQSRWASRILSYHIQATGVHDASSRSHAMATCSFHLITKRVGRVSE